MKTPFAPAVTRAVLLAAAVSLAACAQPAEETQSITGTLSVSTFATPPVGVRAIRGGAVVAEGTVARDGRFHIDVPQGAKYRLEVVTAGGVHPFVRGGRTIHFDVCQPEAGYEVGVVRYWRDDDDNHTDPGTPGGGTSGGGDDCDDPWPCDPTDPNCGDPWPCGPDGNCPPPPCDPADPGCDDPWPCDPMDPNCGDPCQADGTCPPPPCPDPTDPNCGDPWPCDPSDPNCEDPCLIDPTFCDPPDPCYPGDPNCGDPWPCDAADPDCDDPCLLDPTFCDPCILDPMMCDPCNYDPTGNCWPEPPVCDETMDPEDCWWEDPGCDLQDPTCWPDPIEPCDDGTDPNGDPDGCWDDQDPGDGCEIPEPLPAFGCE